MPDALENPQEERWSTAQTQQWYRARPWLCGFNYVTSTAVNSTEMWQRETFDPLTIERELAWAERIGFNTCRVFLQYLVWTDDSSGLLERIERFLEIAARHQIATMFCLFDDCAFAGKQPYLGPQDEPIPGVHNSGWVPSPGHERVVDQESWPKLREYVTSIVTTFAQDDRVVIWDLYNEPGNERMGNKSLPLLQAAFVWARACRPIQPLTAGVWNRELAELNMRSLELSDIVTFHHYASLESLQEWLGWLKGQNRPLVCTEWMSRSLGSTFERHLSVFQSEQIGCYFWGLVNGRTQTHFPWGSPQGAPEPALWHHDLLHNDGSFYLQEEESQLKAFLKDTAR